MSKNIDQSPSLALATRLVDPSLESIPDRNARWQAADAEKTRTTKEHRKTRVRQTIAASVGILALTNPNVQDVAEKTAHTVVSTLDQSAENLDTFFNGPEDTTVNAESTGDNQTVTPEKGGTPGEGNLVQPKGGGEVPTEFMDQDPTMPGVQAEPNLPETK